MRRGSGAMVADRSDSGGNATADRAADEQDVRMNDELHRLVLAHKARGGDMAAFLYAARRQAECVYTTSNDVDDVSTVTTGRQTIGQTGE